MKNIIITGTSRGIGFETAKILARQGHQILALSRKINAELKSFKNITCLSVDLTLIADLQVVQDYISDHWDQVDALIHNAGALVNKPFENLTFSDFEYVYQVNVFAVAQLTQRCIPFLKPGSHVLTISSMGGIQGSSKFPGLAAYSSSKGAVITLSELLAEEYKNQQIAFNVLALGAVQTEMLAEAFPGYQAPLQPEEMANYIADFALNGHRFYNGKVLQVSASTP
jgi:NAD(P)-dependent dehydrogenase (short-subunit alcohol dehydrogenase family)